MSESGEVGYVEVIVAKSGKRNPAVSISKKNHWIWSVLAATRGETMDQTITWLLSQPLPDLEAAHKAYRERLERTKDKAPTGDRPERRPGK